MSPYNILERTLEPTGLVLEASTQQTFVDILDNDVIKPLESLKETNDKTRNRIHDDLKASATKYADHAEGTISKLQQAYLKKYRALEASQRPEDDRNKRFGGKVSALFRGRREDLRGPELSKPAKSEEVSDDECRKAVYALNEFRWSRVENLRDGYDCLEELVFTPTIKEVLAKYMDGMIITRAKYDDLAMKIKTEVENALDGTDTSNLRASFSRALSYSIPPLTLYRNYRPSGYSNLIFGVPLVDQTTSEDNVPKVLRMCMKEVEKRGLDIDNLYSLGSAHDPEVMELRRRFESESSFSFSSADSIHSVAKLLRRYLWDLPEPLLVLSLQEYKGYTQNAARNNDISLLRLKIRELHPVYRETLGALLRHFSRVASHSDKNGMTVKTLAIRFGKALFRGDDVLQDGIQMKTLVMEDLIQNVHSLFVERPYQSSSQSSPVPSNVEETTSTYTYGSLFLSPELPQSTIQHHSGFADGIPTSSQSSLSPSDAAMDSRRKASPTGLLSPLLGLPSSKALTEGVEISTQEPVMLEVRGPEGVKTLANNKSGAEVVPASLTSVAEWRLHQSRLPSQPEALTNPRSPPESVLSSTSDFPLSSATSLQTRMGGFSP